MQAVCPINGLIRPLGQLAQDVLLAAAWNFDAGHLKHPDSWPNFPGLHMFIRWYSSSTACFLRFHSVGASVGHGVGTCLMHDDCDHCLWYIARSHASHCRAPGSPEYFPGGQASHSGPARSIVFRYLPAWQCASSACLSSAAGPSPWCVLIARTRLLTNSELPESRYNVPLSGVAGRTNFCGRPFTREGKL